MKLSERTYYHILGFLIFVYLLVQILKPAPLDWSESFSADHKIPYGGYLIHELLPEAFPGDQLSINRAPIFEYTDTTEHDKNWIFMNSSFGADRWETDRLLSQIEQGTQLFVAARSFNQAFGDTLKVETKMQNPLLGGGFILTQDTAYVRFTNPDLQNPKEYPYYQSTTETYFSGIDSSLTVSILGKNEAGEPNFLGIKWGEGHIYLHSNPTLFTNYFMRDEMGAGYAFKALSYLPNRTTIWDEYYKDVRRSNNSVLSYVVSEKHLKWAWYLGLCGILLFMIFKARRKQRVIPVIEPPRNSSLEFARTIGNLYLEKGDHRSIAQKKIHFFFDYIRSHLRLDTTHKDDELIELVALRSGMPLQKIKSLFGIIQSVDEQDELSTKDLKTVTQHIDQFYKQSQR